MTSLPPIGDLDGSTVGHTQGIFKTAIGTLRTFIADLFGADSGDLKAVHTALKLAEPGAMRNISLAFSVNASALTIAVKDAGGSDASAASPVLVGQRSATASSAQANLRSVAAALSLTVSSGATLGQPNASTSYLYAYLLDNSGAQELAVSAADYGASGITTTTLMSVSATSASAIYSATARSNVPFRKICRFKAPQTTAGTWTATPTQADLLPWVDSPKLPSASRSSNTILSAGDNGTVISATTTFTQTLTAAATLGDGWFCDYRNDGTGIITLDPNSTEQIDGQATINLYRGESCRITCNGTGFKTVGRSTGWVLIDRQTPSAVAAVAFTQGFTSDFDEIRFVVSDVIPATNDVPLSWRVSEDGGSSWKSGGSDYSYTDALTQAGAYTGNAVTTTQFGCRTQVTNVTADGGVTGQISLYDVTSATHSKHCQWTAAAQRSATGPAIIQGGGRYVGTNNAINGIQFFFASGNIASGAISMYGLRK